MTILNSISEHFTLCGHLAATFETFALDRRINHCHNQRYKKR